MLSFGTTLTNRNAAIVLRDGLARVAQGEARVDCSALTQVDSAAVAVMLALRRAASGRGKAVEFVGVTSQLGALARLYGVDALLGLARTPTPFAADFAAHPHRH